MFFNKANFDQLNGFDENFFLYFEENDFCLRSFKINKNYQINNIKVKHHITVEIQNESEKIVNQLEHGIIYQNFITTKNITVSFLQ